MLRGGARMKGDRGDAGVGDQSQRQLQTGAVTRLDPGAELDRDRQSGALRRRPCDGNGELGLAQKGGAGTRLQHLRDGTSHVQVDQIRAGGGDGRGRIAHHLGIGAEELDRNRPLVGVNAKHLLGRAPIVVSEGVAGDHLRDREPGAVALGLHAHEPVADAGERGEQDTVSELEVGDAKRRCQGRLGDQALRSQISLSPVSVSRSSISSIVSQKGTIALARPPVAMNLGSPPSSCSIRRASPSISPAKPKMTPD